MKKVLFLIILSAVIIFAKNGYVENVNITKIATENNFTVVSFKGSDVLDPNGNISTNSMAFLNDGVNGSKKLALLLSALQAGNSVDLWASGSKVLNKVNYYLLNRVSIYPTN